MDSPSETRSSGPGDIISTTWCPSIASLDGFFSTFVSWTLLFLRGSNDAQPQQDPNMVCSYMTMQTFYVCLGKY